MPIDKRARSLASAALAGRGAPNIITPPQTGASEYIQAALDEMASDGRKGRLRITGGSIPCSSTIEKPDGIIIEGDSRGSTVLYKAADWTAGAPLIDMSGSGAAEALRNSHGGLMHITLSGGLILPGTGGPLVKSKWTDHNLFFDIDFRRNQQNTLWFEEDWDSRLIAYGMDYCGSSTYQTGAAIRWLGLAGDKTNEFYMGFGRHENFTGTQWDMNSNGGAAPYGIYGTEIKFEYKQMAANLAVVDMTADINAFVLDTYYLNAGGAMGTGVIGFNCVGAHQTRLLNGHVTIGQDASATHNGIDKVFRVFSASEGHKIDGMFHSGTAPTTGFLDVAGGNYSDFTVSGFGTNTPAARAKYYTGTALASSGIRLLDQEVPNTRLGRSIRYLNVPSVAANNGLSTPHQARFEPGTAEIVLVARYAPTSWATGSNQFVLAKFGTNVGYAMYIDTTGKLAGVYYTGAASFQGVSSTAVLGFAAGQAMWLKVVMNPAIGHMSLYTSPSGAPGDWALVGQSNSLTATAVTASPTTPLTFGEQGLGAGQAPGKGYVGRVFIDSIEVVRLDCTNNGAIAAGGTFYDKTGNLWTLGGAAALV